MDALQQVPLTLTLGKIALAAGTTSTLSNTGTTVYAIRGKAYSRAAMVNTATPTVDAATGLAFAPIVANQGTLVVVGFDAAGNLKAAQGSIQALDAAGNFVLAPQPPSVPDTMCPIGYVVLKAGSALVGNWQFGTSNLSAVAGMTYTFVDLITLADRPQVS